MNPTDLTDLSVHYNLAIELTMMYLPKLLLAGAALIVGLKVITYISNLLKKSLEKKNVDLSLRDFLSGLLSIGLKLALIIAVIEMVGFKTTSFVAILGAAGLAVGLALQGSLANFAGGVLILLFRPFKTGDYIVAQGEEGTVSKIDIFNTWLLKLDNRRVILPNGNLASGSIINVTAEDVRRVDLPVGVCYQANIDQVRSVLMAVAAKDSRIHKDPEPFVGLSEMADSSVNFTFRVWCNTPDYWDVHFDTNEAVKKALDEAKISIPFPQRDVHLYQN